MTTVDVLTRFYDDLVAQTGMDIVLFSMWPRASWSLGSPNDGWLIIRAESQHATLGRFSSMLIVPLFLIEDAKMDTVAGVARQLREDYQRSVLSMIGSRNLPIDVAGFA